MKIDEILITSCLKLASQYFETSSHAPGHRFLISKTMASAYHATKITTKLYAARGPTRLTLHKFKLFIAEYQIKNIIALGLAEDFVNYGFCNENGDVDFTDGDLGTLAPGQFAQDIHGTLFAIEDEEYLNGNNDLIITTLLDSYAYSLIQPTIVHCMAGTGRTGHAIMTFLFFEFLFYGERTGFFDMLHDAIDLLRHFKKILEAVRKLVPKFVHNCSQFLNSIQNAFYLYEKVKTLDFNHIIQQLLLTKSPHLSEIAGYEFLSLDAQEAKKIEEEQKTYTKSHTLKAILVETTEEKLNAAIQKCSLEIASNPSSISALMQRADLFYQHGNVGWAIVDYSEVIKLTTTQSDTHLLAQENRAFLYNKKNYIELAISDYMAVIKSYIDLHTRTESDEEKVLYAAKIADMYERIANIYLLRGNYQSAEAHYENALQWDPDIIFNPDYSQINEKERQKIANHYPKLHQYVQEVFLSQELQAYPSELISKEDEENEKNPKAPVVIVQVTEPASTTSAQATLDRLLPAQSPSQDVEPAVVAQAFSTVVPPFLSPEKMHKEEMKFGPGFIAKCEMTVASYFVIPVSRDRNQITLTSGSHRNISAQIDYHATQITERLFASRGPTKESLTNFKSYIHAYHITQIVALGLEDDFVDYGYGENNAAPLLGLQVHKLTPTVFGQEVQGTRFYIADGTFLDANNPKILTHFITTYTESLTHVTNVHCRIGTGRTGHFIMTYFYFEFLLHGEQAGLFEKTSLTPKKLMEDCKAILQQVRQKIPNFVHSQTQFLQAIKNAIHLYRHVNIFGNERLKATLLAAKPHLSDFAQYAHLYSKPTDAKKQNLPQFIDKSAAREQKESPDQPQNNDVVQTSSHFFKSTQLPTKEVCSIKKLGLAY